MTVKQPELGVRSEKGRREENQDKMSAFSTPLGEVYIVADGMGGHQGGAEASRLVVEGYSAYLKALPREADLNAALQGATTATNSEILTEGQSGNAAVAGMGSTVVLALLRPGPVGMEMLTAHIGDSRAYLVRDGVIRQLTRDHSAVQRMVDEQLITPEAARSHPDLNVLTRAIGKHPDVAIEVGHLDPLHPGDVVLLCTDGLWGHVPDAQLLHELTADRPASETADALVHLALEQGSDDNITIQVLRIEVRSGSSVVRKPYRAASLVPPIFPGHKAPPVPGGTWRTLFLVLLSLVCLGAGVGGAYYGRKWWKAKHFEPLAPIVCQGSNNGVDKPCPPSQPKKLEYQNLGGREEHVPQKDKPLPHTPHSVSPQPTPDKGNKTDPTPTPAPSAVVVETSPPITEQAKTTEETIKNRVKAVLKGKQKADNPATSSSPSKPSPIHMPQPPDEQSAPDPHF